MKALIHHQNKSMRTHEVHTYIHTYIEILTVCFNMSIIAPNIFDIKILHPFRFVDNRISVLFTESNLLRLIIYYTSLPAFKTKSLLSIIANCIPESTLPHTPQHIPFQIQISVYILFRNRQLLMFYQVGKILPRTI